MKYQSARNLKSQFLNQQTIDGVALAATISTQSFNGSHESKKTPPVAIGITGAKNDFKIAIRIQRRTDMTSPFLHEIKKRAKGEVDIKIIGAVSKQATPWYQKRARPVRIGGSIGHFETTAGSLGCFVTKDGSEDFVLSNNHVLANENKGKKGDAIIQPGNFDGGTLPSDVVGKLDSFIRLSKTESNLVDCAMASLSEGLEYYVNDLDKLGEIKGVRTSPLDEGETVFKVGRTTGVTKGKVSAIEVDRLDVGFDVGAIKFDNQIEIEPIGNSPFSLGGDSGSLIVDENLFAVALLFAGNDVDATFANPIHTVLDQLKVDLVF